MARPMVFLLLRILPRMAGQYITFDARRAYTPAHEYTLALWSKQAGEQSGWSYRLDAPIMRALGHAQSFTAGKTVLDWPLDTPRRKG
jgi:hypothetical protein